MTGRPANTPEDMWRFVKIGAEDECWPWQGHRVGRGYGRISVNYANVSTHRLAFQLSTGTDPGEFCVLHRCDNPPCCNPAHLFLGTLGDNNRDRAAKGRSCRGTGQHDAKLTEADVREIRRRRAAGELGIEVAAAFGVTPSAISLIAKGRTWRHV